MAKYCPEKDGPALYLECAECDTKACRKKQSTVRMFEKYYQKPYAEITQTDLGPAEEMDWGENAGNEKI